MDSSTLVESRIKSGLELVRRFVATGESVSAAFWLRAAELRTWHLYIVTDSVEKAGPTETYRKLGEMVRGNSAHTFGVSELKAIGPDDPVARDVQVLVEIRPDLVPNGFGPTTIGHADVSDFYIYPPSLFTRGPNSTMTKDEVLRQIVERMEGGIDDSPRVTLRDGTSFLGRPFGLEMGNDRLEAKFIDGGTNTPRVYPVAEISSIR